MVFPILFAFDLLSKLLARE